MIQDNKRILAIDLARGIAVFFMILVHAMETLSTPEVCESTIGRIVDFLGESPAAPVFMCLMGVSFYFSRHTGCLFGIRRGVYILTLGYVLNLARYVLPAWILQNVPSMLRSGISEDMLDLHKLFLCLDILQFAGLAIIVMSIIRACSVNRYVLLFFAAFVAAISPQLWGLQLQINGLDRITDYLWGSRPATELSIGNWVGFPFFPWFSYVLMGMFLGQVLHDADNQPRVLKQAGFIGIIILTISLGIMLPQYNYQINDYYDSRTAYVLFASGIILFILYTCQLIIELLPKNPFFSILFNWSRNVNRIYIIQWILIAWTAYFWLGFHKRSLGESALCALSITILTHLVNVAIIAIKNRRIAAGTDMHK